MINNTILYEKLLKEKALQRNEIIKYGWRIERFIDFVQNGKSFKTSSGETPITLTILDSSSNRVIVSSSNLTKANELDAFKEWLFKGNASGFKIKPFWNDKVQNWQDLEKDKDNFQYEILKSSSDIVFGDKSLSPSGLGLTGKINIKSLAGIKAVINKKYDPSIANILNDLLDLALSSNNLTFKIDNNLSSRIEALHVVDRKYISKDFGEILCAIILSRYENYSIIEFPILSNNPFVDFSLINNHEQKINVSDNLQLTKINKILSIFGKIHLFILNKILTVKKY
jgi:hypothetical protein